MPPTAVFTVLSIRPPTITWRCPTCHRPETFACSERFRANSNGKLVDIWLIYRCVRCETTKNITVLERTPVRRVPPGLLGAAQDNDGATARRLARDVDLLRRAGAALAAGDDWTVSPACPPTNGAGDVRPEERGIRLSLPEPLILRLDVVVARIVGMPRRIVREAMALPAGAARPDALRRWGPVVDVAWQWGVRAPTA